MKGTGNALRGDFCRHARDRGPCWLYPPDVGGRAEATDVRRLSAAVPVLVCLPLWASLVLVFGLTLLSASPALADPGALEQVSAGSNVGSYTDYKGSSADGRHVIFMTSKQLDPADTDNQIDVYDRFNGVNTLISTSPIGGNGPYAASFDFVSQNGATVVFETNESLTVTDTDASRDVYQRTGGVTALVSRGPSTTNGSYDAFYEGASSDATKIFFGTNESLLPSDADTYFDTYMRSSGATTLLTTGPNGGNGAFPAEYAGSSRDGTHVFF